MTHIHLNHLYAKGEKYYLKTPMKLEVCPFSYINKETRYSPNKKHNNLNNLYWIVDTPEFDIIVIESSKKRLKSALYEYMTFIYEDYAMEDDSKLSSDAIVFKKYILENTYKGE